MSLVLEQGNLAVNWTPRETQELRSAPVFTTWPRDVPCCGETRSFAPWRTFCPTQTCSVSSLPTAPEIQNVNICENSTVKTWQNLFRNALLWTAQKGPLTKKPQLSVCTSTMADSGGLHDNMSRITLPNRANMYMYSRVWGSAPCTRRVWLDIPSHLARAAIAKNSLVNKISRKSRRTGVYQRAEQGSICPQKLIRCTTGLVEQWPNLFRCKNSIQAFTAKQMTFISCRGDPFYTNDSTKIDPLSLR